MKQSSYSIGAQQKDIRALAGDHYVNTNIKVAKTSVNAKLKNGILPAGTIVSSVGAPVTGATAFGVTFADVDFNGTKGTEILPVCIHGFLSKKKIKEYTGVDVTAEDIAALNMIKFL
ncbi:MAG: hypothetical protein RSF37_14605 [Clostridium sp.]|uniref:hypothetical protein n=1 Tax=Clostridium sp. TaxID=1506 RepID=UPI002FC86A33